MTVTVGTDVYDTVENVDAYHDARGNVDWAALALADKEIYMRKATDWLERNFTWRGTRAESSQRLGWPRLDAYDDDDYQIGDVEAPWQVKEAMAIVADLYRDGSYDLTGIVTDDDAAVTKTKVDVIEVEYDSAARLKGQDVLSHIYQLLTSVTTHSGTLMRS